MRMNNIDDSENSTFDDDLTAAATALATEVTPERDLWPEIEQAISLPARHERTGWNRVWAQAAAVLLLVGGSSGLTYLAVNDDAGSDSPVAIGGGPALQFETVSGSFGSMYHLGPDYQDARRSLSLKVDDQLSRLSAEERESVQKNMDVIRTAIDDINIALADQPDNALLQKLLISTYREELNLMMRVEGITSAAMRRGDI
jgi:hypothetical protein